MDLSCPLPHEDSDRVVMAHGGGGRMSQRLFESIFRPAFSCPELDVRHDGAILEGSLAFSTDSYVVRPLEFPGGNIGDLAINGTINDLAMCGAEPLYLSAGFILEEGLEISLLKRVVESMRIAARNGNVRLVTGDTKVVDHGKADGMYLNTSGIGRIVSPVGPHLIKPGDAIILNGDLGAHGVAILSVREGLQFESTIESDTAPLWPSVKEMFDAGIDVHCLRDLTRGGLSSALNEIAQVCGWMMRIDELSIPVSDPVRAACELLGLDPLYVANEGRYVAFVSQDQAERAGGVVIGHVTKEKEPLVLLRSRIGGSRILDMISGEQLPRIC